MPSVATNGLSRDSGNCMDPHASRQHHASVRVLAHNKRLDDCFGQFLAGAGLRVRDLP